MHAKAYSVEVSFARLLLEHDIVSQTGHLGLGLVQRRKQIHELHADANVAHSNAVGRPGRSQERASHAKQVRAALVATCKEPQRTDGAYFKAQLDFSQATRACANGDSLAIAPKSTSSSATPGCVDCNNPVITLHGL